MKTSILNINFDVIGLDDATHNIIENINLKKKFFVVTANPEIVMLAQKDIELKTIINNADLVVPDGIGIVLASRLNKTKIKSRLAGYDLVQTIFSMSNKYDFSVYFLGSTDEIVSLARDKMQKKYDRLKIIGVNNGFFDDELSVIRKINLLKPDVLLVGLGSPKQEKFISKYKNVIDASVFIGIGGSFDVMSGKLKRAPRFFINLNLEWLYRFITQPKRFFRLLALPKFLFKVLFKALSERFSN